MHIDDPIRERYASKEMVRIFSSEHRYKLWRKLWVILAEEQKKLGLPITDTQIDELKKYENELNLDVAEEFEKKFKHDVMAHIHAYGAQAKSAAKIIHLGATSCYITDNADLIRMKEALGLCKKKLLNVIDNLSHFALTYKDIPCLAYTHLQPAQPTTVGKRACSWIYDLMMDFHELENLIENVPFRSIKGTTGTYASFTQLFNSDSKKVFELESHISTRFGFKRTIPISGQTYSRKIDITIASALAQIATSAAKFAQDVRFLQSRDELQEYFSQDQVGSSAMPYKQNPMKCERINSLARYVGLMIANPIMTAQTQFLERTLDDSANRRIVITEGFLLTDAILELYLSVSSNLVVNKKIIEERLEKYMPIFASENILMEAVKKGGNRQELHNKLREITLPSKSDPPFNLTKALQKEPLFKSIGEELDKLIQPKMSIGLAEEVTASYIENEVQPILKKNKNLLGMKSEVKR
jgi:adenylosuccinate lyase